MILKPYFVKTFLKHIPINNYCRTCSTKLAAIQTPDEYPMNEKSYLFISGRYGAKFHSVVLPFYNLEEIKTKLPAIQTSLQKRNQVDQHDLENILQNVSTLQKLIPKVESMKKLPLPFEGTVKLEYTQIRDSIWDVEETLYPDLLSLPNSVDDSVPVDQDEVIFQTKQTSQFNSELKTHQQIGENENILKFVPLSPTSYFLLGKLSCLELKIGQWFSEYFRKSNFPNLTCPDFVNTLIVEGTGGIPKLTSQNIILCDKEVNTDLRKMHLTGSASFESMCAFLTKLNLEKFDKNTFKGVAYGRAYNAAHKNAPKQSLYSVVQYNCVRYLIASEKQFEMEYFNDVYGVLKNIYDTINIPYRIVNVAAQNLPHSVCKHVKFELFSPYLKEYIPVGHICCYKDFVSRKLNMTYGKRNKPVDFLYIMSGEAVNIATLLGVMMEHYQDKTGRFVVPEMFK